MSFIHCHMTLSSHITNLYFSPRWHSGKPGATWWSGLQWNWWDSTGLCGTVSTTINSPENWLINSWRISKYVHFTRDNLIPISMYARELLIKVYPAIIITNIPHCSLAPGSRVSTFHPKLSATHVHLCVTIGSLFLLACSYASLQDNIIGIWAPCLQATFGLTISHHFSPSYGGAVFHTLWLY